MGKPIGIAVFVLLLLPAAAARAATPADCAGFAAKDAAPFLGVPAAQVTRHVEKVSPTLWWSNWCLRPLLQHRPPSTRLTESVWIGRMALA